MAASVSGVGARNGNGVRVGKGLIIIHSFLSFFLRGGRSLFLVKFAPRALEGKSQWAATKITHLSAGSKQFLYVLYFLAGTNFNVKSSGFFNITGMALYPGALQAGCTVGSEPLGGLLPPHLDLEVLHGVADEDVAEEDLLGVVAEVAVLPLGFLEHVLPLLLDLAVAEEREGGSMIGLWWE